MDLDDLHMAVVIGHEGSLSAAAVRLGISPGTLSKALARLERATRVRLFERLARGMRPTESGAAFLARAEQIDLAASDLRAQLRDLRQARAGVLRFGVGQGVPDAWIRNAIVELVARGVTLELAGGMTDLLQRDVLSGELAFAVFGLIEPPDSTLTWTTLVDDPMHPVAPRTHPLASVGAALTWAELAGARWVMMGRATSTWREFERNFLAHDLAPPEPVVISRSSNRERLLSQELNALLLMPRSAIDEPSVRSRFTPVYPEGGWTSRRVLGIAHRTAGYLSPAAIHAMECLKRGMRSSKPGETTPSSPPVPRPPSRRPSASRPRG